MEVRTDKKITATKTFLLMLFWIAVLIAFLFLIKFLVEETIENKEKSALEFENKYRPICEGLGGEYLESGINQNNWCYFTKDNITKRTCLVEKLNNWYAVEC